MEEHSGYMDAEIFLHFLTQKNFKYMKNFRIQIADPCHEEWDQMSPNEKGSFCQSCQKTVVDFSKLSDRQVAAYFKNPPTKTCGRFRPEQLNRTIPVYREMKPSFATRAASFFLTSMLAAGSLQATTTNFFNPISIHQVEGKSVITLTDNEVIPTTKGKRVIEGIIVDKNNKPLVDISVICKDSNTFTDKNGKFKLAIPDDFKGTKILVTYTDITHKVQKVYQIDSLPKNEKIIFSEKYIVARPMILGMVSMTPPPIPEQETTPKKQCSKSATELVQPPITGEPRIDEFELGEIVYEPEEDWVLPEEDIVSPTEKTATPHTLEVTNIYPNPTSGEVNIQLRSIEPTEVTIRIFSIDKKIVQEKKDFVVGDQLIQLTLTEALEDGMYFIQFKDAQNNQLVEKIIFSKNKKILIP